MDDNLNYHTAPRICVCGYPHEGTDCPETGCTIFELDSEPFPPPYWSGANGFHWEPGQRTYPPEPPDRAHALMDAYDAAATRC